MSSLVGLVGKKRSGKDTFAEGLIDGGFQRFAFADALRSAVLATDPLVYSVDGNGHEALDGVPLRLSFIVNRDGWEKAKARPEVRRLLQEYGVAIRALDADFWVRVVMEQTVLARLAVVTDVRFPNEVDAIKARGGTIIRIERPGLESTDEHVSETALDDYVADLTVSNAGTAWDLIERARALVL